VIRSELRITVGCDCCTAGLRANPDEPAGVPTVWSNRRAAMDAIATALFLGDWVRLFDSRLLCPACAAAQTCRDRGHDYAPDDERGGWRMCACQRSIPAHADAPPDPAGGDGCGITWRLCGRCDHIDEHPITDPDPDPDGERSGPVDGSAQVQPGGHLRQDVPAGLALPTPIPTRPRTSGHETSREALMVEPITTPRGAPCAGVGGVR
jgi:hypothetical protein